MSREYDKFADRTPDQIFASLTANQRYRIAREVCVEASGLGTNGNSSSLFARNVVQNAIVAADSTAILRNCLTRLPDGKYVGMWHGDRITVDDVRNAGIDSHRSAFSTRIHSRDAGNMPLVLEVKGGVVVRVIDLILGEDLTFNESEAEILLGHKRDEPTTAATRAPVGQEEVTTRAGGALELAFRAGYADGYQDSRDNHNDVAHAWRAYVRAQA